MDDEILIGEGVALDARPASFASRTLGALVDVGALVTLGWLIAILALTAGQNLDEAAGSALLVVLLVTITVVIPTAEETLTRGRSLGKAALGLRVVRDDGGPVRFRHAVVRALVGVFEIWLTFGSVALITSLLHPRGKRLGDILAGTYAVRVRGGQRPLPPLVMPAELAGWARSADIRRLPDGLALSVRQFLGRVDGLHLASRVRLGLELAAEVEPYVAPGPPAGTHPERFLAAVLAERRDREYVHAVAMAQQAAAEAALVRRLPHSVPDPAG
ncbi:MAG TPA: RDD family protein [Actinotalea sp.]|nr:RDD family protein [Actinotalea sp.]